MDMMIDTRHNSVPLPEIAFEQFYKRFNKVSDIIETKEWKETYSHYYSFDKYELTINIQETKEEVAAYTLEKQQKEIVKCAMSFNYFCHKYIKILHILHGLVPLVTYKYQRRAIEFFEDNRFNIISKFRQGGLTTVTVLWALWRCLFKLDQQVMTVSKTDREATRAGEIARRAMEHLPAWMLSKMRKDNEHERIFQDTGSAMRFHTPLAARGNTMNLLIIDEAAFIPDMEEHWGALYPTINMGGRCIVISTVNGMGNWYEEWYHRAEEKQNQFNVIDLDYWEHPEYNDPEWVESTKQNLGIKKWRIEVERSFATSGDTFIDPLIVAELSAFTRNRRPMKISMAQWKNESTDKKLEWDDGAYWQWKKPTEGKEYILAADAAEGIGENGDNNAFQVVDVAALEQVAEFYSNNIPPREFSRVIHLIGHYYNNALVVIESEKFGFTLLKCLEEDLEYENIYYELVGKQQKPGLKPEKNKRPQYLEILQHRVESKHLKVNSRRFTNELNTFIFNPKTKKVEAQKGKHDDLIMSMCMALYVRDIQYRDMPLGADADAKNPGTIFRTELFEQIRREILDDEAEDWLKEDKEETPWILTEDREDIESIYRKIRHNDKLLKEFNF